MLNINETSSILSTTTTTKSQIIDALTKPITTNSIIDPFDYYYDIQQKISNNKTRIKSIYDYLFIENTNNNNYNSTLNKLLKFNNYEMYYDVQQQQKLSNTIYNDYEYNIENLTNNNFLLFNDNTNNSYSQLIDFSNSEPINTDTNINIFGISFKQVPIPFIYFLIMLFIYAFVIFVILISAIYAHRRRVGYNYDDYDEIIQTSQNPYIHYKKVFHKKYLKLLSNITKNSSSSSNNTPSNTNNNNNYIQVRTTDDDATLSSSSNCKLSFSDNFNTINNNTATNTNHISYSTNEFNLLLNENNDKFDGHDQDCYNKLTYCKTTFRRESHFNSKFSYLKKLLKNIFSNNKYTKANCDEPKLTPVYRSCNRESISNLNRLNTMDPLVNGKLLDEKNV